MCLPCAQRFLGCHAQDKLNRDPKNTITQLKQIMGRDFYEPELQEFLKTVPYTVEEGPDRRPVVVVTHLGERKRFYPEQIMAMFMKELKFLAETDHGGTVSDVVVSVPAYFTDRQRRAMKDAARVADLNCLRLLSEPTAAALSYGIYQSELPSESPRYVAFVDVGYSATQVCVTGLKKGQLQVLSVGWDKGVGGKAFDQVLFDHFADDAKQRHGIDVRESPKASMRLQAQLERAVKKILSVNPEASTTIECLKDDVDVSVRLTREDFEKMIQPLVERFIAPVRKAVEDAGVKPEDFYAVEVLGNSSRVPALIQALESYFNQTVSRTMNSSECIARGCALSAAMLSPQFVVKNFDVLDVQPYPITFSWDPAPDDSNQNRRHQLVFQRNSPVPSSKILNFSRSETFRVDVSYGDPDNPQALDGLLPEGHPTEIASFNVGPIPPAADGSKSKLKLKARLTLDGVAEAQSVTAIEEREEEKEEPQQQQQQQQQEGPQKMDEDAPQQQQDDQEQGEDQPMDQDGHSQEAQQQDQQQQQQQQQEKKQGEKKKKKVKKEVNVNTETPGLSDQSVHSFHEEEYNMSLQDRIEEETKEKKNAVEEYAINMRSRLVGDLEEYSTEEEREKLRQMCDEMEEWLYGEGFDQKKGIYAQKLEELKKVGDPIVERLTEDQARGPAAEELSTVANNFLSRLEDPNLSHIPDEEKNQVMNECNGALSWLQEKQSLQSQQAKSAQPVLLSGDIRKKKETLERFCNPVLNKPKPAPKEEESKQQQQQGDQGPEEEGSKQETENNQGDGEPMDAEDASPQ